MGYVIEKIEKQTMKSYRNLIKLYKEVVYENIESFVGAFGNQLTDAERNRLLKVQPRIDSETNDMFKTEKTVERYGHRVYLYNSWIGGNPKVEGL